MVSAVQTRNAVMGWVVALAGAFFLNLFLFGLMPGLIQQVPTAPDKLEDLQNIQVIRVKKEDSPLRKKQPKEIKPPKPADPLRQTKVAQSTPKKMDVRPRLQFELNANLPSNSMDLVMPSLEHFSMDMPNLKDVYDLSDLDAGLTTLVRIPPIYPAHARRREIEGAVTVEFLVTKEGLVTDLNITEANPEGVFNSAVISCVSRWKFKPPTVEGIPVTARARTTINFKLDN